MRVLRPLRFMRFAALGGVAMYFLDPDNGSRRRARLGASVRPIVAGVRGVAHEVEKHVGPEPEAPAPPRPVRS
jgi:hypothetical protein